MDAPIGNSPWDVVLQIVIYNLSAILTATPDNAHVYLVFRELCKWSRGCVDLFLPPMTAKRAFTVAAKRVIPPAHQYDYEKTEECHVLPNGKRNGHSVVTDVNGRTRNRFYLSDEIITEISPHAYIKGNSQVFAGSEYLYQDDDIWISLRNGLSTITIFINDIQFEEYDKGTYYQLEIASEENSSWTMVYRYRKSYIYSLGNNVDFLDRLMLLQTCETKSESYSIGDNLGKIMGWNFHKHYCTLPK